MYKRPFRRSGAAFVLAVLVAGCAPSKAFVVAPKGGPGAAPQAFRLVVCSYPRLVLSPTCEIPLNVQRVRKSRLGEGRFEFVLDDYFLQWNPRSCVLGDRTLAIVAAGGRIDTVTGEVHGRFEGVDTRTATHVVLSLDGCETGVRDVAYFTCHEDPAD